MVILAALPGIVRELLATGRIVNPGNFSATVNFLGLQLRKVGLGFLCVDSKGTAPFFEEYDYLFGAIVADVLCPFMLKIKESLNKPPSEPNSTLPAHTPSGKEVHLLAP